MVKPDESEVNWRARAAQTLAPVLNQKKSLIWPPEKGGPTSALMQELCFGTLRHYPKLHLQLDRLLKKPMKTRDSDLLALALIGLYQLQEMRLPNHAVLNETVAATAALGKPWAKGLINGLLRNAIRISRAQEGDEPSPVETHNHPDWFIKSIQEAWPEQAESIFAAGNHRPPLCLRTNAQQQSRDDLLAQLKESDIIASACQFSPVGVRLQTPIAVTEIPGFEQGRCSVQDEGAQLCAGLLDLQPDQKVLDACAAPGGKTGHLLETEPNIQLLALDVSKTRLDRVSDNLTRLNINADLKQVDAASLPNWWDGQAFDRILIDAPCSGTGVIRRHPDIKVQRRASDIDRFCQQQKLLLSSLWTALTPGGLLLYVTCSIMPPENDGQIAGFIATEPTAEALHIKADWGIATMHGRQLLPQPDGPDGFYFSLLRKQPKTNVESPLT